jgi:type IX secretion system PorP/SprF family membrane protein
MMRNKIWLHIAIVILSSLAIEGYSQDLHLSQFYAAPLFQNPGMAGAIHEMDGYINYRKQWAAVTTPFETYAASMSSILTKSSRKKGRWAMGALFYNDKGGDGNLKTTSGSIATAYHVRIARYQKLGLGIQGGFVSRSVDYSQFQWGSQYNGTAYDPNLLPGENLQQSSISYFDINAGMVYSFNNTANLIKVTSNNFRQGTIGLSFHHLNRPLYSFLGNDERQYIKMVAHANMLFSIKNTPLALQPGALFYKQGPSEEMVLGGLVRYELLADSKYTGFYKGAGIYGGAYVRVKDAVVFSALLEFANYTFGVSYDMNTSELTAASGGRGGMEFSLKIVSRNPYFKKTAIF